MKDWLAKRYNEWADLMAKIREARPTKQYATDAIAEKFMHNVLRLPVAHPELNPIELAWSVIKMYVAKTFTLSEVEKLTQEAIDTVTPGLWAKFCAHTEKIEEMYWKEDGLIEDVCEEIILNMMTIHQKMRLNWMQKLTI